MKLSNLWAIVDTQKKEHRFCYADPKKTKGAMAVYDKKPDIPKVWQHLKKVLSVNLSTEDEMKASTTPTAFKFKIEIRRAKAIESDNYFPDEFYYVGKAKNGKDLFVSETCKRKATVIKTIRSLFGNITIIDKTK